VVRGHWFPPLKFLAGQALVYKIMIEATAEEEEEEGKERSLAEGENREEEENEEVEEEERESEEENYELRFFENRKSLLEEEFWKNEKWKEVRERIQTTLPKGLLKDIYEQNFSDLNVSAYYRCPNCCNFQKVVKDYSPGCVPPSLFTRWLFFDDSDPEMRETSADVDQKSYFRELSTGQDDLKTMNIKLTGGRWHTEADLKVLKGLREEADASIVKFQFESNENLVDKLRRPIFDKVLEILAQLRNVEEVGFDNRLDGEQSLRLWKVLSSLPKLAKLNIREDVLTQLENPMPLKNVKSVTVATVYHQSSHRIELPLLQLDEVFPAVTEFIIRDFRIANFMRKATKFDNGLVSWHPFLLLHRLPNAKIVKARCEDFYNIIYPTFEMPQLNCLELKLTCKGCLRYSDFKMFFVGFPNLISLTLTINVALTDFDEQDFVRFLSDNKSKFANLRRLRFRFYKKAPKGMTSKSVLAILRNSNLEEFYNFAYFSFTEQDLEELKGLVIKRNLKIIPAFVSEDGFVWINCNRGSHNWFCLEPNEYSRSFDDL